MFTNLMNFMLSLLIGLFLVIMSFMLLKKYNLDSEFSSSFECGFNSSDRGLLPFSLRFYLLANIFLIFDVELILLFPYLSKLIWYNSSTSLMIFSILLLILSVGLFYEWNQKMLEWIF